MQTVCPWCSHPLAVDDAKVPKGPFAMRCSKCKGTMQVAGDGGPRPVASKLTAPPGATPVTPPEATPVPPPVATPVPPPVARSESPPEARPVPSSPAPPAPETRSDGTGPTIRDTREVRESKGDREPSGSALIALEDPGLARSAESMLSNLGYVVDRLDDWEEKARLLNQGDYSIVVTGKGESSQEQQVCQRMKQLSPESRRQAFLVLIGDEFKSGDGNQAFVAAADLVLHPGEASPERLLRTRIEERARIYRAFKSAGEIRHRRRSL